MPGGWSTFRAGRIDANIVAARRLIHALRQAGKRLLFPIPAHISKNYIEIDSAGLASIKDSIGINYHTDHEFDLAIGLTRGLRVISSISSYEGVGYKLRQSSTARQYKPFLMSITPDLHQRFLNEYLYVILEKDSRRI